MTSGFVSSLVTMTTSSEGVSESTGASATEDASTSTAGPRPTGAIDNAVPTATGSSAPRVSAPVTSETTGSAGRGQGMVEALGLGLVRLYVLVGCL